MNKEQNELLNQAFEDDGLQACVTGFSKIK
jgi:hypothetical protein